MLIPVWQLYVRILRSYFLKLEFVCPRSQEGATESGSLLFPLGIPVPGWVVPLCGKPRVQMPHPVAGIHMASRVAPALFFAQVSVHHPCRISLAFVSLPGAGQCIKKYS